jgi:hypothetical protein
MHFQGINDVRHPWRSARPWSRHGLVLFVAGLVYILIGVSYITAEGTTARQRALSVALHWLPIYFWGTLFIIVGVLSIISSRWPVPYTTWGYMGLTGLSAGWAATYCAGILFRHSPVTNLTAVASWGIIAFLWWAISGLENPTKRRQKIGQAGNS